MAVAAVHTASVRVPKVCCLPLQLHYLGQLQGAHEVQPDAHKHLPDRLLITLHERLEKIPKAHHVRKGKVAIQAFQELGFQLLDVIDNSHHGEGNAPADDNEPEAEDHLYVVKIPTGMDVHEARKAALAHPGECGYVGTVNTQLGEEGHCYAGMLHGPFLQRFQSAWHSISSSTARRFTWLLQSLECRRCTASPAPEPCADKPSAGPTPSKSHERPSLGLTRRTPPLLCLSVLTRLPWARAGIKAVELEAVLHPSSRKAVAHAKAHKQPHKKARVERVARIQGAVPKVNPNDDYYTCTMDNCGPPGELAPGQLWGIERIGANKAWHYTTGKASGKKVKVRASVCLVPSPKGFSGRAQTLAATTHRA
jgi:hypothetical protein